MRRSEDGKVDVAVRRCRAWSAPAAPLSHICGSHNGSSVRGAAGAIAGDHTHFPLPPTIYRLFPTKTVFASLDIPFTPSLGAPCNGGRQAPCSPPAETETLEALKAELLAAKHQIRLLNTASAQSFHSYAALEAENAELRDASRRLREANDELKARLAQRNDEVNEQLHLICDLEKKLEEFSCFNTAAHLSARKSLNGGSK
ncbi:hypothetical protein, conserved [Leishmania donovani]|uniref:Uncharacterized protein n=1 Tax=Leishmania donovani TaxID=5661 RepID=A0A3Q8I940_LEIDO|nr:hypothetical protein, conserved [Leishmania donovani]AYU76904.1 hypothetical protein LdCL_110019300 [Leishmania donovani]TPP52971.1 hypothetical protein CGC21_0615 [Leishmania donovani]CBZ32395.1 hypothetical protein, conserved [Leishmania donovani]